MNRRTFLASSGVGMAAGAGLLGAAPPERLHIKKAVELEMLPKKMSYAERFQLARDVGFAEIECPTTPDQKQADEIKKAAEKSGLRIHSVMNMAHWKYPLSSADPEVVAQSVKGMETSLRNAHFWGADTVLLVPAVVNAETRYRDAWTRSQQQIRRLLPMAEELKVIIGVEEVWNKFLLSPLEFARYIDEFASPWVRAYFDVGNVVISGYPQDWIRTLDKRIVKLHIKDFKFQKDVATWTPLREGEINWPEVYKALAAVGYSGSATVELEHGDEAYLREVNKRFDLILSGAWGAMAKFLIGVLTGIILVGLFLFIAIFALARMREKPTVVADGSTLILDLEGEIPERAPVEFPIPFLERRNSPTVENVWTTLRKAAADSHIKAIVFEPQNLAIGWAKLEEIHADLENFKQSGKPLYAYLKTPGAREYYLATAATRVYMAPEDELNLKGMRFELTYFRNTLDKLGVSVEIEHAGKYKDFGDTFTRSSMSPETKEVLDSVIDGLYGGLIDGIAQGRKKSHAEVRAIVDEGPFLSTAAREKGLVDGLLYEDQMYDELKAKLKGGEIKKVGLRDYLKVPASTVGLEGKQRVAFVTAEGGITRGGDGQDFSGDGGIESEGFDKLLRRVASDDGIKGVVVRIDSPGGEVFASDAIWREMNLLGKKKPMVISMSDVAASGGYYMAMTGDPLLAYPGTITGSIGVVYGKANLHGLYEKLGVTKSLISRGRFATIDSDYEPLSPAAREKLRGAIDDNYRSFVTKVAQARRRKFDEIEPLAQGRVWLGAQAKANGLVDELGGLDRAIEMVKQKARIPKGEKITLVTYPPRRSVFDLLFGQSPEGAIESRLLGRVKAWQIRLWARGGLMRVMPFSIDVR